MSGGETGGDLWRRLAHAQDQALADLEPPARGVAGRAGGARPRVHGPRVAAALALTAIAAALVLYVRNRPPRFHVRSTGEPGAIGQALVADARTDLPLAFSDGSTVTFRAGSAGEVRRLTGDGAEVVLQQGRLEAEVFHRAATLWMVHAGPFKVRVTGTRFTLAWSAGRLELSLHEGAVVVEGALLAAGVPIRAGQRLTIEAGVARTEPLAIAHPDPGPSAAPAADREPSDRPPAPDDENDDDDGLAAHRFEDHDPLEDPSRPSRGIPHDPWLALAQRGAHLEAFESARRLGWSGLCRRLPPVRLLALGDVARHAGETESARRAFEALVARFPRDELAGDAMFSLGRLTFEAGRPAEATRWFKRYLAEWPRGPLGDQAAGRLVESTLETGDRPASEAAAEAYLARAPHGRHAPLARRVLGGSAVGARGQP